MADLKISQLTSATTPLAGTEVLPIVQSATTVKVPVSDLTAGRAVSMLSATARLAGNATVVPTSTTLYDGTATPAKFSFATDSGGISAGVGAGIALSGVPGRGVSFLVSTHPSASKDKSNLSFWTTNSAVAYNAITINETQDVAINLGNITQGTAAKGINFTANTPAAGMTSQLLNWYEEGTWTPAQGAGLTVVGAFSSGGKYTRIGNTVYVNFYVAGATSVAVTGAANITTNLPYTCGTTRPFPVGIASNSSNNVTVAVEGYNQLVVSSGAIAATSYVYVSMTYFVG